LRVFVVSRYFGGGTGIACLSKLRSRGGHNRFGGSHSDDKVARLRDYLEAFTTALKNQPFDLIYIDAFAGSGGRTDVRPVLPLLDGDNAEPQIVTVPGSARLAVEVKPPLHRLVLIEKDPGRFASLEQLRDEFPTRQIECSQGDANDVVQKLCRTTQWQRVRGVIFLDPFGMEIDWSTLEAIAATQALDVWCFFPLMGLYRQAANDLSHFNVDPRKRERLNRVLGTDEWQRVWYDTPHGLTDLLDDPQTAIRTADVNTIERYVKARLASIFKGIVLDSYRIHNERNAPLASLFFAVSNPNPRAVQIASDIAGHILRLPVRRRRNR
jgi:three-Cys-motif partner protein